MLHPLHSVLVCGLHSLNMCQNAGYRVGRQLVERYTASRPRLAEHLDVIKFTCKEFWGELFQKQVS